MQMAVVMMFLLLRDYFAVRLRCEFYSAVFKAFFYKFIIFYYAVMNNGNFIFTPDVRVGVYIRRLSVRRPPRMTNSQMSRKRTLRQPRFQSGKATFLFYHVKTVLRVNRYTGGVVSTVFKFFKPFNNNWDSVLIPYITDNSANGITLR